ncbi:MAG: 4-alpha-glucanotransferase [Candidatus Eremiobacteraeota bacterium]|nr:4-alpha-glucanotransferase [Candidatus Eremiobacteraeota bacterium]
MDGAVDAAARRLSARERLAEALGIERSYRDVSGATRVTSAETMGALVRALGVDAPDEDAAARALDRLAREEWLRPLPPVAVVRDDATAVVTLSLPAQSREVRWQLRLEGGDRRDGCVVFETLAAVGDTSIEGRRWERRLLALDAGLPWGYHELTVAGDDRSCSLIVTPGNCWIPPALEHGGRSWGIALQLYLLRSQCNWGIGDFSDLREIAALLAARGAGVVGLNPLHALFLDDPEHASPYSPASRLFLNVLNIDVEAVPGYATSTQAQALVRAPGFVARVQECRASRLVRYADVAALKLPVLRALFGARDAHDERAFAAFRSEQGEALERLALFEALRAHFVHADAARADWRRWPEHYRDPSSRECARFAREHADEVAFFAWLQWIADEQLQRACEAARSMPIGLYRDLAVGADPAGAETWSRRDAILAGVHVGAPPDVYNPHGQDWGLPAPHPHALREGRYASSVRLLRANMRHAGALRLDHAMALLHLYLIPEGFAPAQGAYVRYPIDDLMGILALESRRHRCLIVGEDLGTVPAGFRERMAAANVLSYRLLYFETDTAGAFVAPQEYPRLALAVVANHDLPTLHGWWHADDITLRARLGLLDEAESNAMAEERARERAGLLAAMQRERLLGQPVRVEDVDDDALLRTTHAFLARTSSLLVLAQLDDVVLEHDPVNIPATSGEYPNWRRRLSANVDELAHDPRLEAVIGALRARSSTSAPPP